MALNQEFPVLDGIAPSWADIAVKCSLTGAPLLTMADIKSISTATSMEIGEQRGATGGRVRKRTTGSVKHEASMVLYYSGYQTFMRELAKLAALRGNQRATSLVHFGINVLFTPPGDVEVYEFRIKGCRYTGRTIAPAEGVDAQTVDVALNTIEIVDVIDKEEIALL